MGDLVNLKRARKGKARSDAERKAEESRRLHGRTKSEKLQEKIGREAAQRLLDQHLRDKPDR